VVQFLSTLRELARKSQFSGRPVRRAGERLIAAGCINGVKRLVQELGDQTITNLKLVALTLERAQQESPALA